MITTVTEHAKRIGLTRKSASQRLDKMVAAGLATKVLKTLFVDTNRYGRKCRCEDTLWFYTVAPGVIDGACTAPVLVA